MNTLEDLGKVISTDILIIGGGLAGLLAAIKAKDYPVDVLVVDKATTGWAGQVPHSGGFTLLITPEQQEAFTKWMLKQGECLNDQQWLDSFVKDNYKCIRELDGWGAPLVRDEKGEMQVMTFLPISQWNMVRYPGDKLMVWLRGRALAKGAKLLNKIEVVELLREDNRIVGAVGFDILSGQFYIFKAKATILANASCDFRVRRLFTMCTGEGIAAAYRAGAELRNAEFGNVYGPMTKEYDTFNRGSITWCYVNAQGENIVDKYCPWARAEGELYTPMAKGMVKEIMEGRGPIYLDLRKLPSEDRDLTRSVATKVFWRAWDKVGVDLYAEKIEIVPAPWFKLSPIRIDLECKTTLPGLWAVGDTSMLGSSWSGVVPGGDIPAIAIPFAMITGMRAGSIAAEFASKAEVLEVSPEVVRGMREDILNPLTRTEGLDPGDAIYRIQEVVAPVRYNFFRSKDRMEEALAKLQKLEQELGQLWAKDGHQLAKCHEAKSMALCAEAVFRAALMRTESRGVHWREDYPERDDHNWLRWIIIKKKDEKMTLSTEPIPIESYKFKPDALMKEEAQQGRTSMNNS